MALRNSLVEIYDEGIRTKGEIQVTDAIRLLLVNLTDNGENRDRPESALIPPVYVAPDAVIERSIIGPGTSAAAGCVIRNSIISNSIISAGARVEDSRLMYSLIGNDAVVNGSSKTLNLGESSEIGY